MAKTASPTPTERHAATARAILQGDQSKVKAHFVGLSYNPTTPMFSQIGVYVSASELVEENRP